MTYTPKFAGLDIETTGSDLSKGAALIQIGVVIRDTGRTFVSDVCPDEDAFIDPESMAIHKIPMERLHLAPTAERVDERLYDFLRHEGFNRRELIPVGWNVAGFDVPFVLRYLPRSGQLLSYRSVDLNAVCFTLANAAGKDLDTFKEWSKKLAVRDMQDDGYSEKYHDALYDAKHGLKVWKRLTQRIDVKAVAA